MTLGILATIKIQPGKNEDFEAAFGALQSAVRANETGCLQYDLFKLDAETYLVYEQYADEAAAAAHGGSDHFKTLGAKLGPSLAGRPDVKRSVKIS